MKKKLTGKGGLTLVELLISLVIVMMATLLISTGSNLSLDAYRESKFVSESGVLTETLDTALSDIFRYAAYTDTDAGGHITFKSQKSLYYAINDGYLVIRDGIISAVTAVESGSPKSYMSVVGKSCYTSMYIDKDSFAVAYDAEDHVFSIDFTICSRFSDNYSKSVHFDFKSLSDSISFGTDDEESEAP